VVTMVQDHWTVRRRGASLLNAKGVRVSLLLSEYKVRALRKCRSPKIRT
jgi:hypothetical protein